MALTISTKTYNLDSAQGDQADYVGPANTLSVKDIVRLKRVKPKKGGGTNGVARPFVNLNKTCEINATTHEVADNALKLEGSFAVGTTSTDIDAMAADMASFLTSTAGKNFLKTLVLTA